MIHINAKERALVNSETGEVIRPSCYDTLVQYISYLEGRSHPRMAQDVLNRVFEGERVISKMVENSQKHFEHETKRD